MYKEIVINLICTKPIKGFGCKSVTLKIPELTPERNRSFLKDLYGRLKGPLYGYFEGNTVFFIGDNSLLYNLMNFLTDKYGIKQPMKKISYKTLDPQNANHRKIIQRIVYPVFEGFLQNKGFLISLGSKIAIPTPYLQSQVDHALIHEENCFESFYYNIRLSFSNRMTLQIDPCITVLKPYTNFETGDWVFPQCFETECQYFNDCQILPRNSVVFKKKMNNKIENCKSHSKVAVVHNPRKNETLQIPSDKLYIKPSLGTIPYRLIRAYSLKDPESRIRYTERFFKLLENMDGKIALELEEQIIEFQSQLMKVKYNPSAVESAFQEYSIIPEVLGVFGEDLLAVSPFDGLKKYGTYSYNKADGRYPHPKIRLFSIYPTSYEKHVSILLHRIQDGHYLFSGFNDETNPYKTSVHFENVPIDYQNESDYIRKVKARIRNIQKDYPWGLGYLFLFVIPPSSPSFYDEIKDFCLARKMRSQMIRHENLGFGWYPLYNFSLSLYTKAGGTPWTIDSSYFNLADCYIGMGFSRKITDKLETGRFFLGAADVFNSYGEHLSFVLHQASVDREIKGLHVDKPFIKELMNKAIDRYFDKMREVPNSIAVHKPVSFHKAEIEGIQEIMTEREIGKGYLIHVQHNSRFRAYDKSISYQIRRGTYYRIGPGNIVLFPTGYLESQKKEHKMGTPKAVQLNVRKVEKNVVSRDVTAKELYEVCRNFFGFTRLRWNMLGTRLRDPLTIYASRKVAEWLRKGYKGLEGIDVRDIL